MLHHHYHVTGTSPKGKINSPAMPLSIALEEAASYAKASNLPRVSSGVYGADFYSSGDAHFNGTWIIVEPCDMKSARDPARITTKPNYPKSPGQCSDSQDRGPSGPQDLNKRGSREND